VLSLWALQFTGNPEAGAQDQPAVKKILIRLKSLFVHGMISLVLVKLPEKLLEKPNFCAPYCKEGLEVEFAISQLMLNALTLKPSASALTDPSSC